MSEPVRVSVVMPFLNQERFIEEAVESVLAQTYPSWELLLVDDGSVDASTAIARDYARLHPERIRYFEHPGHGNRGASASRNLAIHHARGEFIAFLDADDVWFPHKLEQQVAILDAQPEAGSLYGHTLLWRSWSGGRQDRLRDYMPQLGVPANTLLAPPTLLVKCLRGEAFSPATCSLLVRRSVVEAIGAFEDDFRLVYTDQAFYTKLFLAAPVYVTDGYWDKYRQHADSSITVVRRTGQDEERRALYLRWTADYLSSRGLEQSEPSKAVEEQLRALRRPTLYRLRGAVKVFRSRVRARLARTIPRILPRAVYASVWSRFPGWWMVPAQGLSFGSLHRVQPVSRRFGSDRGMPIPRYYLEDFLGLHAADLRGRVLQIGEDLFLRGVHRHRHADRDGTRAAQDEPAWTTVADLGAADQLPPESFDCVLIAQALQGEPDPARAVRRLRRLLAPGGTCLVSLPGICQIDVNSSSGAWFWTPTPSSAQRLFEDGFGSGSVQVASYGNVLVACALLQGLAAEELMPEDLDHVDPAYPVMIAIRAVMAAAGQ